MAGRFGAVGLAWRMTLRSRPRLLVIFLIMTVIALLLTFASLLGRGMEESLARSSGRLGADLMVLPAAAEVKRNAALIGGVPVKRLLPEGAERYVTALPGVKLVAPQYFLTSAPASCCEAGNLQLIGFDPSRDFTVLPWLSKSGSKLQEREELLTGGGVMKGKGAEFRIYDRTFRVAARLEKSGIGYFDNALFIPFAAVEEMRKAAGIGRTARFDLVWERPSILLVRLSSNADFRKTASLIETAIPGVRVMTIPELLHAERQKMAWLAGLQKTLIKSAWLIAVTIGGLAQLLYWRERRPTLGLLQAWGYGKGELLLISCLEIMVLSLAGMVAGGAAAVLILEMIASRITLAFGLQLMMFAGTAATAGIPLLCLYFVSVMVVITLVIILTLSRREPADLMRGS